MSVFKYRTRTNNPQISPGLARSFDRERARNRLEKDYSSKLNLRILGNDTSESGPGIVLYTFAGGAPAGGETLTMTFGIEFGADINIENLGDGTFIPNIKDGQTIEHTY